MYVCVLGMGYYTEIYESILAHTAVASIANLLDSESGSDSKTS